ncbi:hypothetical protein BST13_22745 [Mycobacterium aquaticum]|uniref:DUF5642 domain-containing protein n=1 Tax=Mycobacterium aquaticum TaxID=1927124 RepID=A0A1X0AQI2_9MYCO|nr:hypothetical protein BST13_22745 [Mycobacterium aquaticum]
MGSRIAAFVVASCTAVVVVVGCSPSPRNAAPTTTPKIADYDISRVSEIASAFPPGHVPQMTPKQRVDSILPSEVDRFADGKLSSVDPPQCRSLLRPVDVSVGSDVARIYAPGPTSDISMMAVKLAAPLNADIPVQGCDHVGYTLDQGQPGGTVERIEAPHIEGAKTQAITYQASADPVAIAVEYTAFLSDRVVITLRTTRKQDTPEPPGLSELLGAAVAAVRGTYTPSQSKAPLVKYDINRLADVKDAFPQGITPNVIPARTSGDIDTVKIGLVVGPTLISVDPPQCEPVLQPVRQSGGAIMTALDTPGRDGPHVVVGASQSDHLSPVELPQTGCEHISYSVEGEHGTVDRLVPPTIDHAKTFAFRTQYTYDYGTSGTRHFYSALIDDNIYITVRGQLDSDVESEQALPELLVKAVAAVRG